ncbi:MAG: nucleotidyltransferase family protein [Planctomycetota bacterium]
MSNLSPALILLAAGDSSRMGSPKALLDWYGKPLIRHILDTAVTGGCKKLIVVLGRDAELIRTKVDLSDAAIVINSNVENGQVSSLQLGFKVLDFSTDCALCWPVDCPLVQPADVSTLIDAYCRFRNSRQRVFIPIHNNERGHPMLVDSCMREDFINLEAGKTARDLIVKFASFVTEVQVKNAGILTDVDTPAQYNKALKVRQ